MAVLLRVRIVCGEANGMLREGGEKCAGHEQEKNNNTL